MKVIYISFTVFRQFSVSMRGHAFLFASTFSRIKAILKVELSKHAKVQEYKYSSIT